MMVYPGPLKVDLVVVPVAGKTTLAAPLAAVTAAAELRNMAMEMEVAAAHSTPGLAKSTSLAPTMATEE